MQKYYSCKNNYTTIIKRRSKNRLHRKSPLSD
nr:MAG TPA: hypothetical protein [Caudoviricetes sp.]